MNSIQIITGEKVRTWGGWYRHDAVLVDGKQIEGGIQVRRRNKRTESTTFFRGACVLGTEVDWLVRQQGE